MIVDKDFIWIPSNCDCKCYKACDVGEYLDYENCKCRKWLVGKFIDECTETVEEVKITSKNEHENKCGSCTMYIVLFSIFLIINVGIGTYFVYSHWYLKKDDAHATLDTSIEATVY